ncbi:MAG: UDP-N-acetylmuramoyl-L-alanine--D-glutamate ligase [Deltaproteobacteria bacterium]|nr:UDP-N-acetylmuramoyl-L-alanine--D-glutamate ligase [Deltaproteobacteria bacterium]
MELEKRKVLVVGLGKTGLETVRFLLGKGAQIRISDITSLEELPNEVKEFSKKGVEIETGLHKTETFLWADTIVLSPGVSFNIPQVKEAVAHGIEVMSEIELASRFIKTPVIAVTGSNGKTTTCSLIASILEKAGRKVFLGGNIGTPLIEVAERDHRYEFLVLELSSFQIQGINKFKPYIATILNVSPNHLDHHESFQEYVQSKMNLFSNQDGGDWAIYNRDDAIITRYLSTIKSKTIPFGREPVENGIFYDGRCVRFGEDVYDFTNMKLLGAHNIENAMAAVVVSRIIGCSPAQIEREISEFNPLPHRIEFVCALNGARFYNDSKSTSPGATLRALECFKNSIILISGGKDKGLNYDILNNEIRNKVKLLVLFGESRFRLQRELGSSADTSLVESLEEALEKAVGGMHVGDTVLFSPACSSFDMYSSYEERGRVFKELVQRLSK